MIADIIAALGWKIGNLAKVQDMLFLYFFPSTARVSAPRPMSRAPALPSGATCCSWTRRSICPQSWRSQIPCTPWLAMPPSLRVRGWCPLWSLKSFPMATLPHSAALCRRAWGKRGTRPGTLLMLLQTSVYSDYSSELGLLTSVGTCWNMLEHVGTCWNMLEPVGTKAIMTSTTAPK